MKTSARLVGLIGGLLVLDLLLNLPGFLSAPAAGALLAPSIDLLVVSALLAVGTRSGEGGRGALRLAAAAVVLLFAAYAASKLFSAAAILRPLPLIGFAAGAVAAWFAAGLVLRAFQAALVRSIFIALVAVAAILHVLTGNRVLAPSVVPAMVRDIAGLFG